MIDYHEDIKMYAPAQSIQSNLVGFFSLPSNHSPDFNRAYARIFLLPFILIWLVSTLILRLSSLIPVII